MKPVFRVKTPGSFTTVQDLGRFAYQHMGVPVSGSLDTFASSLANQLVGNPRDSAVLEITLSGPTLEVLAEVDVAVTGADMGMRLNGINVPLWRSFRVAPGDVIEMGWARAGCRSYLGVTGGVLVPMVMGSRSTYVSGRIGGVEGRPLKAGDTLQADIGPLLGESRRLPWFPNYPSAVTLRAIPGPQEECFGRTMELFFSAEFVVGAQANRMGYRLQGPILERDPGAPKSIVSEPSMPGNVQVPADGQPIILLVEQTIGGYAKIATVITPDLFRIAQAKPGDAVRFSRVSLEEAHEVYREWFEFTAGAPALVETP